MINKGLFSSATYEWETPREFFDAVDKIFHFDLDVCATASNAKCGRYFTKEEDGLAQPWRGICWMNPPYGREIGFWIKKAYESSLDGKTVVVCLLPVRTDTKWWHDYVIPYAKSIDFIRGRLRFSCKGSAPFPSALVVFGGSVSGDTKCFDLRPLCAEKMWETKRIPSKEGHSPLLGHAGM
jgi:phage N-6-adenine-methyltransferase